LENRFNPITDYLDSLDWDGKPRLETWLIKYLSAEDIGACRGCRGTRTVNGQKHSENGHKTDGTGGTLDF